jgi:hypothetical protein
MTMETQITKQNQEAAPPTNAQIADTLDEIAELLEVQNANPFRVRAYRTGAETIRTLKTPVNRLYEQQGLDGLETLDGIGRSLARAIERLLDGDQLPLLQRLRGDVQPAQVFTTISGIGPALAERIYSQLNIESLADLHAAAYDGRLAQVPGFGPKRIRAVRESLDGRLRRPPVTRHRPRRPASNNEPPVADLLDIDREYRAKATANRLPTIAPRRFNPTGESWLPVLHTSRGNQQYTALYSNTARAHELGTTHDWVVIYRDDQDGDGQWTVITSRFGALQGKRLVRGREDECRVYYTSRAGNRDELPPDGEPAARSEREPSPLA